MKTKEYDLFVHPDEIDRFDHKVIHSLYVGKSDSPMDLKCKLTIELPEKKIEITESDLYEAFTFTFQDAYHGNYKVMAGKLFGKDA